MYMNIRYHIIVVLCVLALVPVASSADPPVEYHTMISWGDQIIVCGPGTDAAMDSPQAITNMMKRLKGRGFTGIAWRADLADYAPGALYINDTGVVGGLLVEASVTIGESFDVLTYAKQAAEAEGLEFWVWLTTVYSDGSPQDFPTANPRPFTYERAYVRHNPEVLTVDRQGNIYYGIREYAYPGARADKVQEILWFAEEYGITNIIADMRSEASQFQLPPDHADRYGFNQPVVDEMQSRYGIDILTDPDFDVDNPAYDPTHPDVQLWHDLRGEYLTQFYRDLRAAMDAVNPTIQIGVMTPGGDYIGPVIGNIRIDWQTWIDEGLVQQFIMPQTLAATEDPDSPNKGYLTDQLDGTGVFPISTFNNYADSSPHPETRFLHTGGDRYHRLPPPSGADGWRTWFDQESSDLGWYQRWQQWKQDLIDFGHIKFFSQNFDDFPVYSEGRQTGWGDYRYLPSLRHCPGLWWPLGDGSTSRATAQDAVFHGDSGRAIKLTRGADSEFHCRHLTITQRAYWSVDQAIMNGTCRFEYWLYRPDTSSSLTAYLRQEFDRETAPALWFLGSNVRYRLYQNNQYYWYASPVQWPVGSWQRFAMVVDLDNHTYSAFAGPDDEETICTDVPFSPEVTYFNMTGFLPQGTSGSVCYLDDVCVQWIPTLYYKPRSRYVYLADDFESHVVDQSIHLQSPDTGSQWTVSPAGQQSLFFVENDLSYADGWKCLTVPQISDGTILTSSDSNTLVIHANNVITVDLDIFVETNKQAIFGLAEGSAAPFTAAVKIDSDARLHCQDGIAYVDTGVTIKNSHWHHVQIALDTATKTYQAVLQESGTIPVLLGTFDWLPDTQVVDSLVFKIGTLGALAGSLPYVYYDNIDIRYGLADECGNEYHPYPTGDLSEDCRVDTADVSLLTQGWLSGDTAADLNSDGIVNLEDYAALLDNWQACTFNCN